MDWIKVKTVHILDEYTDLNPLEFNAWIKIMALAARLEHEPTREQILKHVHQATLKSLDEKLMKHSCCLHDVLMKVLCDVHDVLMKRETWKHNKKQYRELAKNVSTDVSTDVSTQDKIRVREDKIINNTPLPPKGDSFTQEFLSFWEGYPKKIGKKAAWKAWRSAKDRPSVDCILKAVSRQKQSEQWQKDSGIYIPNPATWINQGRWDDELGRGKGNSGGGSGVSTTPAEWIPEKPISEEQRLANLARVKGLISRIG